MPVRKISSHFVLTPEGLIPRAIVSVDGAGVIVAVEQAENLDGEAGVEFFSGILVPGFVNAHCHLELSFLKGAIASGGGFTAFAKGMRNLRRRGAREGREAGSQEGVADSCERCIADSHEERIAAARYRDAKMWAEGIQAVGDVCNGSGTFAVKAQSRIRYHNFCELFGLGARAENVFALRDKAHAEGLCATVTPHSTYSLSREGFASAVGDESNSPLSIHFMESPDETDLFGRNGELWEWYKEQKLEPDFLDFGSPAQRLVAQVPPSRPVMLIHNTMVTPRDIETVMGHFTARVTWVLCVASNRYITGLTPPIELLRSNGLDIAIGTDSLASNDDLSPVREIGMLKGVPLVEALGWATIGGARALGVDDLLGSIEQGKRPGLAVLTGVDMQTLTLTENARATRII